MITFGQFLENNSNQTIIKNAFSKGIDQSDTSILGYHGTSLQTLIKALNTGYLAITAGTAQIHGGTHDSSIAAYGSDLKDYGLHIVPNPLNKIVQSMTFRNELEKTPYKIAMRWASSVAERHSLFDKYNLDMNNPEHHEATSQLVWGQKPKQQIEKEFKLKNPKRKYLQGGIVLAISDNVTSEFKINVGGDGDDINIITTQLPVKYIVGIEPENDAAYEWLDQIN